MVQLKKNIYKVKRISNFNKKIKFFFFCNLFSQNFVKMQILKFNKYKIKNNYIIKNLKNSTFSKIIFLLAKNWIILLKYKKKIGKWSLGNFSNFSAIKINNKIYSFNNLFNLLFSFSYLQNKLILYKFMCKILKKLNFSLKISK